MKKILIILITIPLIFGSCEKEDDSPNSNSGNNPIGNTSNGTTGYVVDDNYDRLYKTTNSGSTWVLVTDFDSDLGSFSPTSISFINGTTGYVVDDNYDRLYKTTNSGSTWVLVTDFDSDLGSFSPTSISFIN